MTKKSILVKGQLTTLSKLALLPWLQIYHDNKENGRPSLDSPIYTHCIAAMVRNLP